MPIISGTAPIVGIRQGSDIITRAYKGADLVYEAPAVYEYPVVIQTSRSMDLPDPQSTSMVVNKYSFAEPLTPGNWLVTFMTSGSDRMQFNRPGWQGIQKTLEGSLWPRIDAKKITADTPQEDLVGWAELGALSGPIWVTCEVAGVHPSATSLPCTVGGDQGWGFEGRTAHTAARTINADKTLFMGFQCVRGSTSGNTGDASYTQRIEQASAPQNRACGLYIAPNQPAGKSMPMIRTGGSDYASAFSVAKITNGAPVVTPTPTPTPGYPIIVQSATAPYVAGGAAPVLSYSFPTPLNPGNWLVAFLSSESSAIPAGWARRAFASQSRTNPQILTQKITADTPRVSAGGAAVAGAVWTIVEVAGINPAATTLPGTFHAMEGRAFMGRPGEADIQSITANGTLALGFQAVRPGSDNGDTGDASYTRVGATMKFDAAGQNRVAYCLAKPNQQAGTGLPTMRTTGFETEAGYCVAKIVTG